MVAYTSDFYDGQTAAVRTATPFANDVEVVDVTYTVTGDENANDTIDFCQLPNDSLIVGAFVAWTDVGAATCDLDIGVSGGDANALFDSLDMGSAGFDHFNPDSTTPGTNVFTADSVIRGTIDTADFNATGTIRLVLLVVRLVPE